jgi:hypothetical protein
LGSSEGVNHLWVPIGSKIVAQFVGCYAAKDFENAVLIDDDKVFGCVAADELRHDLRADGYPKVVYTVGFADFLL